MNRGKSVVIRDKDILIDGSKIQILSGAIHYFRSVPGKWADLCAKAKAMGLNTVETYVAWDLHEPYPGKYDFGAF